MHSAVPWEMYIAGGYIRAMVPALTSAVIASALLGYPYSKGLSWLHYAGGYVPCRKSNGYCVLAMGDGYRGTCM